MAAEDRRERPDRGPGPDPPGAAPGVGEGDGAVGVLLLAPPGEARENCRLALEASGYKVVAAADLDGALQAADNVRPEAIAVDVQALGLEILRQVQANPLLAPVPLLAILRRFAADYAARVLELGAADYLLAPVQAVELDRRLAVLVERYRQQRQHDVALARYRLLFDGEQQGLFFSSREGRFLDVNQALVDLLGYDSKEELLQIDIARDLYWDANDRRRFQELIERDGYIHNFKVHFRRKDGEKITILLNGRVVRDHRGQVIGYQGSNVDITAAEAGAEMAAANRQIVGRRGLGRAMLDVLPKVLPFGSEVFSFMRMTEVIGERYEKVERLGLGSYGEIWKVRDLEAGGKERFWVAKIPKSKKLNVQIRREAAILAKLQEHPNAVAVVGVVEDRGRAVLIQEYVCGRTLQRLMERPLEPEEKKNIVMQLVDVVAHAHRHRIIHRDIKPENIVVRPDGTVKLLDFGVAKELKDKDISSTMVGSRPFMAPEQIMGESQIASDVWALGVIIYGIYTEYLPFYHENEKVLMDLILSKEPEPPRQSNPDIPEPLEKIILKCLRKDPARRYADAGALKAALHQVLS